jgi:hypothetical protein
MLLSHLLMLDVIQAAVFHRPIQIGFEGASNDQAFYAFHTDKQTNPALSLSRIQDFQDNLWQKPISGL